MREAVYLWLFIIIMQYYIIEGLGNQTEILLSL